MKWCVFFGVWIWYEFVLWMLVFVSCSRIGEEVYVEILRNWCLEIYCGKKNFYIGIIE